MNSGAHIHAYPKPHYMAKSHWTMYSNRSLFMEITVGINIIVTIVTEITDTEGHKDVFFYNNEAKRKTCYWWVNNYKEFWKDWRKMGLRFGGGATKKSTRTCLLKYKWFWECFTPEATETWSGRKPRGNHQSHYLKKSIQSTWASWLLSLHSLS